MAMHAEVFSGDMFYHLADNALDIKGQRAAIGIAQHNPARTRIIGSLRAGKRIFRIRLIAVKKMLGIVQRFAFALHHQRDGFGNHADIFGWADTERGFDLRIPAFTDQANGFRTTFK